MIMLPATLVITAEQNGTIMIKGLEAVFLALLAGDERQTEQITRDPQHSYETNRLLGKHPSTGAVRNYFAAAALAHMGLTHLLPEPYRKLFQGASIGIEQGPVRNNLKAGLDVVRF